MSAETTEKIDQLVSGQVDLQRRIGGIEGSLAALKDGVDAQVKASQDIERGLKGQLERGLQRIDERLDLFKESMEDKFGAAEKVMQSTVRSETQLLKTDLVEKLGKESSDIRSSVTRDLLVATAVLAGIFGIVMAFFNYVAKG